MLNIKIFFLFYIFYQGQAVKNCYKCRHNCKEMYEETCSENFHYKNYSGDFSCLSAEGYASDGQFMKVKRCVPKDQDQYSVCEQLKKNNPHLNFSRNFTCSTCCTDWCNHKLKCYECSSEKSCQDMKEVFCPNYHDYFCMSVIVTSAGRQMKRYKGCVLRNKFISQCLMYRTLMGVTTCTPCFTDLCNNEEEYKPTTQKFQKPIARAVHMVNKSDQTFTEKSLEKHTTKSAKNSNSRKIPSYWESAVVFIVCIYTGLH